MDMHEIRSLIVDQAEETDSLEFKRGEALAKNGGNRTEMVKDISGMANAAGGRIIYGLSERKENGRTFADELAAITDPTMTRDWMLQVLAGNTSPPLGGVTITNLQVSDDPGQGRVFVVDVAAASTAHQNTLDQRYYQRIGTQTLPMLDFQIRDVMNRRSAPNVRIELRTAVLEQSQERHRYRFRLRIENIGFVSLRDWTLKLWVPEMACSQLLMQDQVMGVIPQVRTTFDDVKYVGLSYFSRLDRPGPPLEAHPGQVIVLGNTEGLPELGVEINRHNHDELSNTRPPIRWVLYAADTPPIEGTQPFEQWCLF